MNLNDFILHNRIELKQKKSLQGNVLGLAFMHINFVHKIDK